MPQFLLLLHDDPKTGGDASADEIQQIIGEYVAWRRKVEEAGQLVGGEKLTDEGGRVLSSAGGQLQVVDGPFAEAKEVLGGFFMVEAENYDAAVELASDCPHLKYGERIEIRQVDAIH